MHRGLARIFKDPQFRRWLIVAAVACAIWLVVSFGIAYKLTRRPRPPFAEPAPVVAWGQFEDKRLTTTDGEQVGAWYAEGRDDAPTVVILHGNKGNRRNSLGHATLLATEAGCSVLLISLRAHGDSTGDLNDIGFGARHDVVAAVEFVRRRRPGKPVIVFGTSLGAAAAIFAAGDLGDRVQGYILESPYRDLKTAVWHRTETYLPPVVDRLAYLGLRVAAPIVLPNFNAISPLNAIGRTPAETPVMILSGAADTLARPEEARALYNRVRTHARLEVFPGGTHHDVFGTDRGRYRRLLLDFCGSVGDARAFVTGPLGNRDASAN